MAVKKYQVDDKTTKEVLKECNECMNKIDQCIGNNGDGVNNEKTLIGVVERMNEKCWSDGKAATEWYQDFQKNLDKINKQMKNINESFETLALIENIN